MMWNFGDFVVFSMGQYFKSQAAGDLVGAKPQSEPMLEYSDFGKKNSKS